MDVLVTGGAGFIGSHLVDRLLAEGHRVDVVDDLSTGSLVNLGAARAEASGRLKIHQADVHDEHLPELFERRRPEVVIHLAGPTAKRDRGPRSHIDGEIAGTVAVLAAAAAAGARKVVTAAAARRQADPVAGIPARAVHEYLAAFQHEHGLTWTTLVLPTVYGARQTAATESCVVAVVLERLRAGDPIVLHGGGSQTRDLLFVHDAVDAVVRALDRADGDVVEIGTGVQTPVRDLVDAAAAALGVEPEVVGGSLRVGEPGAVTVDVARAATRLGWSAWTALADGLAELAALSPPGRT